MLRHLRGMDVPASAPRTAGWPASWSHAYAGVRRLCAARWLDTYAIDALVGRTFAIEQIVVGTL